MTAPTVPASGRAGDEADRQTGPQVTRPARRVGLALDRWPATIPAAALAAVGIVGPVVILAGYSLGILGDGDAERGIGFYTEILTDSFYLTILWRTVKIALIITFVTLALGYPLAVVITRARGWRRTALLYAVITPLLINIVVRTLGWLVILSDQGLLNSAVGWFAPSLERQYLGTELGMIISLAHIGLPLMVLPMLTSIESQDPSLREAALVSGAHPVVVWWRVQLPLLAPGIVAGCTLVFVLGISSLITPAMLGRGRLFFMSTLLVQQIGSLQWGRAGALALLLFAIVLAATAALQWVATRSVEGRAPRPPDRATKARPVSLVLTRLNGLDAGMRLLRLVRPVYLTLVIAYLLVPMVIVLKSSIDVPRTIRAGFTGFTLSWYGDALDGDLYFPSFLLSLRLAAITVVIGLVVALPAAFAIARGRFPGRRAILALLMSPLLLPQSALAVGFVLFYLFLGTAPSFERLLLAHLVVSLPFLVRVLVSAFEGIDPATEEAAAAAGASPGRVLRRVTLPMVRSGIFAAVLFAFLTSFDEATVGVLVAPGGVPTLPIKIFSDLQVQYTPVAAAVSGLLILLALAVILPLERWVGLLSSGVSNRLPKDTKR